MVERVQFPFFGFQGLESLRILLLLRYLLSHQNLNFACNIAGFYLLLEIIENLL